MKNHFVRFVRFAVHSTSGQDLVEYALVVALIGFGAVASMQGLSTEINVAFGAISSQIDSALATTATQQ